MPTMIVARPLSMDSRHYVCWDIETSKKMLLELKFFARSIALLGLLIIGPVSSQAREGPAKTACHRDTATNNVTFLAFLPCLQRTGVYLNDTRSILEECDLLTRAAVSLAIERWNEDALTTGNITLNVASLSRVPRHDDHSAAILFEDLVNTFCALHPLDDLFGIIGPYSSTEVHFWAPILQRYNLLTISYDITSTAADQESSFYRTLPSDYVANIGRLALMAKFEWFRIAIISSNEIYYAQAAKNFTDIYQAEVRQYDPNGELALLTTFSDSPDDVIKEIKLKEFNIILGYFGARNARKVLCKANMGGLILNSHAWILPSYYNPNWWKIQDESSLKDDECSNKEMRNILESVIFIDTVKFPPTNVPMNTFHSQLVSKALDLFPSLTEEDLKPYLLRSRATSAYDAVTLLARSIRVASERSDHEGNQNYLIDTQVALERIVMYCEYCRLNSGCFLDANETKQCQDNCGSNYQSILNPKQLLQSPTNLLCRDYLLHEFGQILYSQFIEGEECPVAILWHSGHALSNLNNLTTLDDLHQLPCTTRLNISRQDFVREGSTCPQTFQWKGSGGPPRTSHLSLFRISILEITLISILTGVGFLIVVAFLVLNIHWRNTKTIKATSPWLNVVFLSGVVIRFPTAMLVSLSLSTAGYSFNEQAMKLVCNLVYWTQYIGEAVFVSALIMKNWRIYRLFHNKKLKRVGKAAYSDFRLIIAILILQLPIVATLIIKAGLFRSRLVLINQQTENLLYVRFSFCASDHENVFEAILMSYNTALLFVLFLLAFLNTLVHLSVFRREGLQSLQAAVFIFVPIVIATVIQSILKVSFQIVHLRVILWMEFTLGVLLPILTSALLFVPNVWLLVKTKRYPTLESATVTSTKNQSTVPLRVSHYHQLLKERETLKKELSEINEQILTLSAAAAESQTLHHEHHEEDLREEVENHQGLTHQHHEPLQCQGSSAALIGPS